MSLYRFKAFGTPAPLGFSIHEKKANFAVFSRHAEKAILGLKNQGNIEQIDLNRTGDIWHVAIEKWTEDTEYAFRMIGPLNKQHRFNPDTWLADPMSKFPATSSKWGGGAKNVWSLCKTPPPFDWQNIQRPAIPLSELMIYEMHIRGFTRHESSHAAYRGTYLGLIEKIPYFLKLGINAVEFMPIYEFDERLGHLYNYWGYDPLFFFAPMRRYSAHGDPMTELKTLVRELHRNGIEVLLDVVYNHTGEIGNQEAPCSFKGLDNSIYYMLDREGNYLDYTGCKNTFNANHPVVIDLILSSLHFWTEEFHIDGFRFDLAASLTRGEGGQILTHPPLLQAIGSDPRLSHIKLIAENWDAAGLYQVGHFPSFGSWSEWNGKFRDRVRNFIKGTDGYAGKFADVFSGSQFLYPAYHPLCSVNFVTAHDGFSLNDLVSYNHKHNEENGLQGLDGSNENFSWNCGIEGPTADPFIQELRQRQIRNFFLALFLSQGIPMLFMGDEYGHTRRGNNNPFGQDNKTNWFLWDEMETKQELFEYVANLIAFRKSHPQLRQQRFLTPADVDWHGEKPFRANWSPQSRFVACTLKGPKTLYIAFNADSRPKKIFLPEEPWHEIVRTDLPWTSYHLKDPQHGDLIVSPTQLSPYSALLAQGLG